MDCICHFEKLLANRFKIQFWSNFGRILPNIVCCTWTIIVNITYILLQNRLE